MSRIKSLTSVPSRVVASTIETYRRPTSSRLVVSWTECGTEERYVTMRVPFPVGVPFECVADFTKSVERNVYAVSPRMTREIRYVVVTEETIAHGEV